MRAGSTGSLAAAGGWHDQMLSASLEAAQELAKGEAAYDGREDVREEKRALRHAPTERLSTADAAWRDLVREAEEKLADMAAERFRSTVPPAFASAKPIQPVTAAVPLLATFDAYAAEQQIKPQTRIEWRAVIEKLVAFLGHDDAAQITADDLDRWRDMLLAETTSKGTKREPRTVRNGYFTAIRTTLAWALEKRKLPENVATQVVVRVPRKAKLRERDFTNDEAKAILAAALAAPPARMSAELAFARRWIPWLCAYTGARVNEISQLRKEDVLERDGIHAIRITPEAGTVKANAARVVPLHPHLIEQGFLAAVSGKADGPLFYDESRGRGGVRRAKKVGERLASWVREDVGITDPGLQPNHGWRHTFKTRATAAGIPERVTDAIQGHAPTSVSRG